MFSYREIASFAKTTQLTLMEAAAYLCTGRFPLHNVFPIVIIVGGNCSGDILRTANNAISNTLAFYCAIGGNYGFGEVRYRMRALFNRLTGCFAAYSTSAALNTFLGAGGFFFNYCVLVAMGNNRNSLGVAVLAEGAGECHFTLSRTACGLGDLGLVLMFTLFLAACKQ